MRNIIAVLVTLLFATILLTNTLCAQCVNGVCQVPSKAPVLKAIAAPVVAVLEAQPVRRTVAATVNLVATVPQVVRQTKPVRSLAYVPVRVLQRQPVRSVVRRIFCR